MHAAKRQRFNSYSRTVAWRHEHWTKLLEIVHNDGSPDTNTMPPTPAINAHALSAHGTPMNLYTALALVGGQPWSGEWRVRGMGVSVRSCCERY